VHPERITTKF
jgi:hypothetical protein